MKKTLLIITIIATIAITFFACSEREHTNPLDSEYWDTQIEPVSTFTKTVVDLETIRLNWSIAKGEYPDGYKFRIDRKTGSNNWVEKYKMLESTESSYTDPVTIDETYQYKVFVSYDENISASKDITHDNIIPTPTTLTVTQTSITSTNLTWIDNSIGEEKFEIERKLSSASTYTKIGEVTGSDTSSKQYSDTTPEPGQSYDYRVKAVYGSNNSDYVNKAYTNTFAAPTTLNAEQQSITEALLTWTDNSIGEDKFEIERKLSSGTTYTKIGEITGSDTGTKTYNDTGLTIDLTYDYRVKAVHGTNSSAYSNFTYENSFQAPTNLTYTALSSTSLELDWTYNITGIDGFKIDRKVGTAGTWVTDYASGGSDITTWTDNSYDWSGIYYYKVRAYYSTYTSDYSNEVQTTPIVEGMVYIPSGSFSMGDDHNVTLTNNFYMNKYEVTNQEYCDILNYAKTEGLITASTATVSNNTGNSQELLDLDDSDCQISYNGSSFVVDSGMENRPVIEVTWYGSAFYCNMLSRQNGLTELYNLSDWSCDHYGNSGFRLPTEAEWEYAARYNDQRTYPWGNTEPTSTHCNFNSNVGHTVDVGSYSPTGDSQLGLCDMAGNVWEWCNDWYASYPSTAVTDPTGPTTAQTYRVLRGGSWNYSSPYCRSAFRNRYYPVSSSYYYGFRVVELP